MNLTPMATSATPKLDRIKELLKEIIVNSVYIIKKGEEAEARAKAEAKS